MNRAAPREASWAPQALPQVGGAGEGEQDGGDGADGRHHQQKQEDEQIAPPHDLP